MNRPTEIYAKSGLIVGLVTIIFLPTLRWLIQSWLGNPYYSHGFLVPIITMFLISRRLQVKTEPWNAGVLFILIGLAGHLASIPFRMHILSAAGLIVVIFGLVLTFVGRQATRQWAFALTFLVLAIPLPFVERLSPPLEAFVAKYATLCVQPLGVAATTLGSQVQLASAAFTVGAPCSGLRSIVALLTLTVLFVHMVNGPLWGKVTLLFAALPIAVTANLVRVSSLFLVADTLGAETGLRYYHALSSPTLFLIALSMLFATSRGVRCSVIRSDFW